METAKLDGHAAGIKKGLQEGREEGREEGLHQKAMETAKNLLQIGLTYEQIAEATGLDLKTVQALHTSSGEDEA